MISKISFDRKTIPVVRSGSGIDNAASRPVLYSVLFAPNIKTIFKRFAIFCGFGVFVVSGQMRGTHSKKTEYYE
ncbi:MAG TPA: hypothetical protein DEB17_11460 [Chlorobaculum sp.]|uniref:Uncharacterized protein n=1 Tax=Chlorobaculum tepidum (strain ATCC 49652 / DSM 12025 / NBRC 103806 / TLS) TaxID=194439 RepID=Q8KCT2_CHLTE|nr:hypothetical protein CT1329 [Chlorobaculum tepidum TLS]HBU24584.1 hypothetical protein [Chlorobaculum sp.]